MQLTLHSMTPENRRYLALLAMREADIDVYTLMVRIYCKNCGETYKSKAVFCSHCGNKKMAEKS